MPVAEDYGFFLKTLSGKQWQRLGLQKRAGVSAPLFSIYSSQSTGIAEYSDLELLAVWCKSAGMSIIQLLPMNDTGFSFTPYDAASTFALEPMYLRPSEILGIEADSFKTEIAEIKKKFPLPVKRIDYGIKKEKLGLFEQMFEKFDTSSRDF